jgi:hypothetical protein
MSSFSTERLTLLAVLAGAAVGLTACTEVRVEETRVDFLTNACSSGNGNGSTGGGQQQPASNSSAIMDTYIVQIFELNNPQSTSPNDCDDCLATGKNCHTEADDKGICICGGSTAVSADKLPTMLQGVRLSVPDNYGSLYCMRVMAVQRAVQSEASGECPCDLSWSSNPDNVRLCAVSEPYAASSLPIKMPVQCVGDRFSACANYTQALSSPSSN